MLKHFFGWIRFLRLTLYAAYNTRYDGKRPVAFKAANCYGFADSGLCENGHGQRTVIIKVFLLP